MSRRAPHTIGIVIPQDSADIAFYKFVTARTCYKGTADVAGQIHQLSMRIQQAYAPIHVHVMAAEVQCDKELEE